MQASSEQINELASALAKAQGKISAASEDKTNPHFRSKYATLDSIWKACREPLSSNGLAVVQIMSFDSETVFITTKLLHSSGQWISSTVPAISGKFKPQELGSATTYLKRYSLASMVGVAPGEDEDEDDGNAAQKQATSYKKDSQQYVTQEPSITKEEEESIEYLLKDEEKSYREDLLKYYTSVRKLTSPMMSFSGFPRGMLKGLQLAISKRKEKKSKPINTENCETSSGADKQNE